MTVSTTDIQKGYRAFRKKYGPMLRAAKREMHTPLQRGLLETIAATAYSEGFKAPRVEAKPVTLKGWKAGK